MDGVQAAAFGGFAEFSGVKKAINDSNFPGCPCACPGWWLLTREALRPRWEGGPGGPAALLRAGRCGLPLTSGDSPRAAAAPPGAPELFAERRSGWVLVQE